MNKLVTYWNQNRLKITMTIIIIVFVILLIFATNNLIRQTLNQNNNQSSSSGNTTSKTESVITGAEISVETADQNENIISEFVQACNSGNYEQAYDMLTEECKQNQFASLELFIQNYCNNIFTTHKTYTLELWQNTGIACTYRVLYINNNILETGKFDTNSNIEDYITIINNGKTSKLNINGFIYMQNINSSQNIQNIEITVQNRCVYRSYEEYELTVINNSSNTIRLSDGINSNDICLVDQNDVEYNSIINQISELSLEIEPGYRKTFKIRFNKTYNTYRTIERLQFKNVVLNVGDEQSGTVNISIDI